jgi:hypothetical protein
MSDDKPVYWFPAKRFGWGWGLPATWQGWVVLIAWLLIVLTVSPFLALLLSMVGFGAFLAAMVAILLVISYMKGEPPRWRWGRK